MEQQLQEDVYKRQLQSSLHSVMLSMDQKIDRLGSMAEELHVAKGHLRIAFCELSHPEGVIPIHAEYPSVGTENGAIATEMCIRDRIIVMKITTEFLQGLDFILC